MLKAVQSTYSLRLCKMRSARKRLQRQGVPNHMGFLNPADWPKPSSEASGLFGHKQVGELVAYWKDYVFKKFKKVVEEE